MYPFAELRAQRRTQYPAWRAGSRVPDLTGYSQREHGVTITALPAGAIRETLLIPRSPCFLRAIGAEGSQPEGFTVQITTDDGRVFPVPITSRLLDQATAQGVTASQVELDGGPRMMLGSLRVAIRNMSGVDQDCDLVLVLSEPDGDVIPATVQAEADLVFSAAGPSDFAESGTSLVRSASSLSAGWPTGGSADTSGPMQREIIELNVNNQIAVLLPAQPVTVDIFSVFLRLDGEYVASVNMLLLAENLRGETRKLCGVQRGIQPGGALSFEAGSEPWFRLQPGERMLLSEECLGSGLLAAIGGLIRYRTR